MDIDPKALEMVQALATKLGQAVETLWPAAVRYIGLTAAFNALIALLLIPLVFWAHRTIYKSLTGPYSEGPRVMVTIFAFLAGTFMVGMAISQIPTALEPTGAAVIRTLSGAK